MKRSVINIALTATVLWLTVLSASAQQSTVVDFEKFHQKKKFQSHNRSVTVLRDGTKKIARLDEQEGPGVAWLEGVSFGNGVIELDLRGKDVLQRSFVGIAFHGADTATYDVIYFRPFNFRAEDPVRHSHAVQYVSLPKYDWFTLRETHPLKYEQPIASPPDPNDWFHAKIVVDYPAVRVFVNGEAKPSLVIEQLSDRRKGTIGLWAGNGSGGDFSNLSITHNK